MSSDDPTVSEREVLVFRLGLADEAIAQAEQRLTNERLRAAHFAAQGLDCSGPEATIRALEAGLAYRNRRRALILARLWEIEGGLR